MKMLGIMGKIEQKVQNTAAKQNIMCVSNQALSIREVRIIPLDQRPECRVKVVWLANRGRLLQRTPGPVHFGHAFVIMFRLFIPELVMSTYLLSFEHPTVLLFCCKTHLLCTFNSCTYLKLDHYDETTYK